MVVLVAAAGVAHVPQRATPGLDLVEEGVGCPDDAALPPDMAALLERLGTTPAAVIGPRSELLGWTDSFDLLVRLQPQVLLAGGGLALAVHLPADEAAEAALDLLVGRRPRSLRSAQPPAPAARGSTA